MSAPAAEAAPAVRSCHWCGTVDGRLLRYGLTALWICSDLGGCAGRQAPPGTARDRRRPGPASPLRLLPARHPAATPALSDVI